MRTITLEEHFVSPGYLAGPGQQIQQSPKGRLFAYADILEKLADIGDRRIAEMDKAGIDVQVLSLASPGTEDLDAAEAISVSREANDTLAEAIKKYPTRFAGFATLPTAAPDKAVEELERTVGKHGFKGVIINGHNRGRYLDNKFFWPILECAEALNVPIYLHPTTPPQPVIDASYGGFDPVITNLLAGPGYGWHIETAIHIIRIIVGGTFDRFPKLQFIIGHMGESLPFIIERLDSVLSKSGLRQPMSAYLRENIYYTFSGFNFTPVFLNLLLEMGADRIMFSADHPYQSMSKARDFLNKLPVSDADRHKIAHGNAESLFGM